MKIILFQPQIPQNTGNIARTCAATKTDLILVHPLGFSISSRQMKRAGLDYWDLVQVETIDNLEKFLQTQPAPFYFFSSKAKKNYSDVQFAPNSILIFGSETDGLPLFFHEKYSDRFYKIPMAPDSRCLNLSSSAAIVLYEALRQNQFIF